MDKMIVFDMDGTTVDWCAGVAKLFDLHEGWYPSEYNFYDEIGIDREVFWDKVELAGVKFWHDLKPIKEGLSFAKELIDQEAPVYVATCPAVRSASQIFGKMMWLESYMPELGNNYAVLSDKKYLAASGRLLIDDSWLEVQNWRDRGGIALLLDTPYNKSNSSKMTWGEIRTCVRNFIDNG